MRTLLAILVFLFCAAQADAQIIAVYFKDEKTTKKYRENMMPIGGGQALVGEVKAGMWFEGSKIQWAATKNAELYVAAPDDPSAVPYKIKGEEKIPSGGKGIAKIQFDDVDRISILIEHQSLNGLAAEYKDRLAKIDDATKLRDACVKGGREWMEAHQRLMSLYERLRSFLAGTAFPVAAKKIDKEMERQRKVVAADAVKARVTAAKEAIHAEPTPPDLIAKSQEITGGTAKFKVMESLHVRVVYLEEVGDERVRGVLEFAEDAIDGFRGDCVDPYVDTDFEDKIPDRLFAEFWYGPEDKDQYERFWTEYYRQPWGDHKAEALELAGTGGRRGLPPESLHYWKYTKNTSLEGTMAHGLGHDLAALHYNLSISKPQNQDWLDEAVGFYISLEFLGNNNVTCKSFTTDPAKYVADKKKAGTVTEQLGLRDFYNTVALDEGPTIDKLALKTLYEFGDADMAKCWSFYDFVVHKEGKKGQLFLRAACEASKDKKSLIKVWREKANVFYDTEKQDVFKAIEDRWRKYAETGQDTGDTKRAR